MKILFYFIALYLFTSCATNITKPDAITSDMILLKITYFDKHYANSTSTAFALINIDKLFNARFCNSTSLPNLVYNIGCNGGYYLNSASDDFSLYTCCEKKEHQEILKDIVSGDKSVEKNLQRYSSANVIDLYSIDEEEGYTININSEEQRYSVTLWSASAEYCVCNIYMDSYKQPIFGEKIAYINKLSRLSKPKYNINKYEEIINKLVTNK